jgi:hypothetical protein
MTRNLTAMSILVAVFILLVCSVAANAEAEDDSDVSMRIPDVRLVEVNPGYLEYYPSLNDMTNGWTETKQVTAVVSANADWVLTIKGSSESWEGPYAKPISDIYWNYGGGDYVPLSTQGAMIAVGGLSNGTGYDVSFRIKLDLSRDLPGDYHYYYVVFEMLEP